MAVEQGHALDHLHALEQLLRLQRLVIRYRQALQRPMTVLVFLDAQLQPTDFKVRKADLAGHQAGPDIRHYFDLIQAQGTVALADHDIVRQQYGRETAPTAFQATDLQGHIHRSLGLCLDLRTIFCH